MEDDRRHRQHLDMRPESRDQRLAAARDHSTLPAMSLRHVSVPSGSVLKRASRYQSGKPFGSDGVSAAAAAAGVANVSGGFVERRGPGVVRGTAVDEYEARDDGGMLGRVHARGHGAERVADEHERAQAEGRRGHGRGRHRSCGRRTAAPGRGRFRRNPARRTRRPVVRPRAEARSRSIRRTRARRRGAGQARRRRGRPIRTRPGASPPRS